jgi:hypothetical protein
MSKRKRKKELMIGIGVILVALIGGILLFGGGTSSEARSPRIVVTPQPYDFGRIPRLGGKVSYDVTLENRGEGALTITSIGFS